MRAGSGLQSRGCRSALLAKPEQRVPGQNTIVVPQPGGQRAVAVHPGAVARA